MLAIFLTIKKHINNRGISLIETVLYITLLLLIMGVVIQILVSMGGVYKNIKLTRELESSGAIAMESMLRDIRNAKSVVVGSSVLGTSPGVLKLFGIDEFLNVYDVIYDGTSGSILISKNSATPTALTSSSVEVSNLIFTYVSNANSEGVRIELEVSGTIGAVSKNKHFYGFAVLRGSY
ncbi:MAG: hypothetical protein COV33_02335 [Candidatus Zambryskibacteria bacterium CG10_big_fil_rev_8_21_14_0_10_34_34]|uniref:Type 4 fimbrial biogenesis protein PilX N-terminal domain-containing protein n=1 Tax=Candidatus Zambryskibacteria bacterium CG10_big_fil_rev_8_21_14_0_10_34_34 TaxID=1975114 RepID=A0A2H0R0C8_9BACT|nr:MAG: hypothetical protein COV33_02335 [Candidatus Zambryskibacteria bacterium CG10_big_fil_rev_8_21_14_0_10_34_34]